MEKSIWYVQSRQRKPGVDWYDEAWSDDQQRASAYMDERTKRAAYLEWRTIGPLHRSDVYNPEELEIDAVEPDFQQDKPVTITLERMWELPPPGYASAT